MDPSTYFRAGVGVIVRNANRDVLGLERSDVPGSWQAPQGGIESGEAPVDAARRELFEEVGLDWSHVKVLDQHPSWLSYELPSDVRSDKTGMGQTQRWFLVDYAGSIEADAIAAGREFRDWRWITMAALVDAVWPPRRPVYISLHQHWHKLLRE